MKKVAVVGIQGIPAQYGGFETLVHNLIIQRQSEDILYTVYCSSKSYSKRITAYEGSQLKYIRLSANGIQSIFYDGLSLFKTIRGYDVILILGVSGCVFLPIIQLFSRSKIIVNIDGLEHRRDKWSRTVKLFLYLSECIAVRYADHIIADNKGIQEYVYQHYQKRVKVIAYGGDHVLRLIAKEKEFAILKQYNLKNNAYSLSICRIEPENNCHVILEAFAPRKDILVFIGNWERCNYGKRLKLTYKNSQNIVILDSLYDLDILYVLRKHCKCYIHGHSAGGTNPSLVEAMFFGRPIIANDVIYNRATTENEAHYFSGVEELQQLLSDRNPSFEQNAASMYEIANRLYRWDTIAKQYEALY